jgi:hypothetical protein
LNQRIKNALKTWSCGVFFSALCPIRFLH